MLRTFVLLKRKIDVGAVGDEREKLPIHATRGGVIFFRFSSSSENEIDFQNDESDFQYDEFFLKLYRIWLQLRR